MSLCLDPGIARHQFTHSALESIHCHSQVKEFNLRTTRYIRSMKHYGTVEMVKVSSQCQIIVSYCSTSRLYVHTLNGKLLRWIETEKIFDMKLTTENYLVTGGTRGVKVSCLIGVLFYFFFDPLRSITCRT